MERSTRSFSGSLMFPCFLKSAALHLCKRTTGAHIAQAVWFTAGCCRRKAYGFFFFFFFGRAMLLPLVSFLFCWCFLSCLSFLFVVASRWASCVFCLVANDVLFEITQQRGNGGERIRIAPLIGHTTQKNFFICVGAFFSFLPSSLCTLMDSRELFGVLLSVGVEATEHSPLRRAPQCMFPAEGGSIAQFNWGGGGNEM